MRRDVVLVGALWLILTAIGELLAVFVDIYPVAKSDKGEEIEHAFRVWIYFAVPVFTMVVAVLVYTVLRHRSVGTPDQDGPPSHAICGRATSRLPRSFASRCSSSLCRRTSGAQRPGRVGRPARLR